MDIGYRHAPKTVRNAVQSAKPHQPDALIKPASRRRSNDEIQEHAKASSPDDRVRHLNAEGFRPPKRSPVFTPNAVRDLLQALGVHRSRNPAPLTAQR